MNATANTLTLGNNWLDTTVPQQVNTDAGSFTVHNNWTYPYYTQPCISTWTYGLSKITLKLSEIERLRSAAKKDKALKEILQKFTGHIEIEVDF
jgi:hypothetical protein